MNAVEEACIVPGFFTELQDKVNLLVGLPYLFSRVSYGDELTIHFGTERKHTHPKLGGKVRGSHVLSVRGSRWMLRSGIRPVIIGGGGPPILPIPAKPFNTTALESGAYIRQMARVSKAAPQQFTPMNSIGLTVDLDDGSMFLILPTPPCDDDTDEAEPADWELLTPSEWLKVGPGESMHIDSLR